MESGEECDGIPDSMRQYLAMQHPGASKTAASSLMNRLTPGLNPLGSGVMAMSGDDGTGGKVVIQHLACRSLSIGTWRRVGQSTMDLVIFYSPDKACMTYYIHNDAAGYKVEYPFAYIRNITVEPGDVLIPVEGASPRMGGLVVELTRPPRFYMDSSGSGGFYECGDFTEQQQASKVMVHHLGGPSHVLCGQFAKLASLDAYQNRHSNGSVEMHGFPRPAVSPVHHRPQSQPNHLAHPHSQARLWPPGNNAAGIMGPPGPRGHKRQRSRSVPVAVDFATLRRPMPSFILPHDGHASPAPHQNPDIFAPIPQHQHPNPFVPVSSGPGGMTIDTHAGYPAFHLGCPPSAQSPAGLGTPGFFPSAPAGDGAHWTTAPYSDSYLSIDPQSVIGTSHTPLSIMSGHGDPVIADHSPPLSGVHGQDSEVFGTPGDTSQFGDESFFLSESFSKQIALPFRSPGMDEPYEAPIPDGVFNFNSPSAGPDSTGGLTFQSPDSTGGLTFQSPPPPHGEPPASYHTGPRQQW